MILSRIVLAAFAGIEILLSLAVAGERPVTQPSAGHAFAALVAVGAVAGLVAARSPSRRRAGVSALANLSACLLLVGLWLARPTPDALDAYRIYGCLPACAALLAGWVGLQACGRPSEPNPALQQTAGA